MARAFVAVVPPEPVLDAVAETVDTLRSVCPERARWVRREQWHLTLRFLGDHVDLDAAASSLATLAFARFTMRLGGVGAFARPSRANVLWIGVSENCAPLTALAGAVRAATAAIAPADGTPFSPHLTVARFDRPADVRAIVHRPAGEHVGEAWRVDELVLVESVLGQGPARHRVHTRIAGS